MDSNITTDGAASAKKKTFKKGIY